MAWPNCQAGFIAGNAYGDRLSHVHGHYMKFLLCMTLHAVGLLFYRQSCYYEFQEEFATIKGRTWFLIQQVLNLSALLYKYWRQIIFAPIAR